MSDQGALVRQWILLKLLAVQNSGLTVSELADEMEVSQKTVRRDLATFSTIGFPIEQTVGLHGRKSYRVDPAWGHPEMALTFDEALALYLGRKFLQPLDGTLVGEAAERALAKIRGSLSNKVLQYLDHMASAFQETSFGVTDYSAHGQILDDLLVGIEDRRAVRITYQSQRATEPVTYDVHPYRLARHQGSLYLVGLKVRQAEFRTWRVDRIEAAEVTGASFTMPDDNDLDARLSRSFGIYDGPEATRARIRISAARARYVREKQWHPSQRITTHHDGSLTIEFHVFGTVELQSWILSFGQDAEVLAPAELRQAIINEIDAMQKKYHPIKSPASRSP